MLKKSFQLQRACVMERYGHAFYRSIAGSAGEEYKVRLELDLLLGERPDSLPAMEIAFHYPGGIVERQSAQVQVEAFGEYHDDERFFAEVPFRLQTGRKGLTYIEVLLNGNTIAGFVFSTSGPIWEGMCTIEYLGPLDIYTEEKAKERFVECLASANEEDLEYETR